MAPRKKGVMRAAEISQRVLDLSITALKIHTSCTNRINPLWEIGSIRRFVENPLQQPLEPKTSSPEEKISRQLSGKAQPFAAAQHVFGVPPHLKMHEIVTSFPGKNATATGRDRAKLCIEAHEQRIVDRFGPHQRGVFPLFKS